MTVQGHPAQIWVLFTNFLQNLKLGFAPAHLCSYLCGTHPSDRLHLDKEKKRKLRMQNARKYIAAKQLPGEGLGISLCISNFEASATFSIACLFRYRLKLPEIFVFGQSKRLVCNCACVPHNEGLSDCQLQVSGRNQASQFHFS